MGAEERSRALVTGGAGFIGRRVVKAPLRFSHVYGPGAGCPGPLVPGAGESIAVNGILAAARSVTGAPIPAEHVPPKQGAMLAVIVDIPAARAPGHKPTHDLKSGIATVWPEWAPDAQGQAAADGKAAQ